MVTIYGVHLAIAMRLKDYFFIIFFLNSFEIGCFPVDST